MSSGLTHLGIMASMAFMLFVGGVLVDLDHFKMFGGSHTFKDLKNGFIGKQYLGAVRNDQQHFMHQPKTYKIIFFIIACVVMFGIGYATHLKMDGLI